MHQPDPHQFTPIPPDKSHLWVVWQFPLELSAGCLGAAVRATEADSRWLPACVALHDHTVYLCTAIPETFATPEAVAAFWEQEPDLPRLTTQQPSQPT